MSELLIRMSADTNIGKREDQEDSVNASRPEIQQDVGVLCVVSDGVGGLKNGKEASQLVVDTMVSTFYKSSIGDTPEQILLRGAALAQEAVRGIQKKPGECGATLVAALIRQGRCSFLSIGDSRIYLYRGGSLVLLTRSQNRARRLDVQIGLGYMPEGARTDNKRDALTGYVGMEKLSQADRSSHSFSVGPGDRIALMTDGVFGTLTEDEITEIMGLPEEEVACTMIDRTVEKGNPYQDNCTVAVMDCTLAETEEGGS